MTLLNKPKPAALYFLGLCFATVLPAITLVALMTWRYSESEKARQIDSVKSLNGRILAAIDHFHGSDIATLRVLAAASSIGRGDFPVFQERARKLVLAEFPGARILLRRSDGTVAADTDPDRASDDPLEIPIDPELRRRAVSDLVIADNYSRSFYRLVVPVSRAGTLEYDLVAHMPLGRLARLLNAQNIDPEYFAVITDGGGRMIARQPDLQKYFGKVLPGLRNRPNVDSYEESLVNAQGIRIFGVFNRSPSTRWGVGTAIAHRTLHRSLHESLLWLALMVAAAAVIGGVLSVSIARIFSRSMQALVAAANGLGGGLAVATVPSPIAEADIIGRALSDVSLKLQRSTDDLERLVERRTRELTQKSELLETTLSHMDQGLLVIGKDKHIELYNTRASELSGVPESLLSRFPHVNDFIDHLIHARAFETVPVNLRLTLSESLQPNEPIVNESEKADGTFIEIRTVPLADGRIVRTYTDATARKRSERRLEDLTQRDPLTGLPNRSGFRDRLKEMIETDGRRGCALAVILIQIEGLRAANQDHGFALGDALMVKIAEKLGGAGGAFAARLKGSLFAVVQPIPDQGHRIADLVRKLMNQIPGNYEANGVRAAIGFNAGIAVFPAHGTSVDELKRNARTALYRARELGPDKCCIYEDASRLAAAS